MLSEDFCLFHYFFNITYSSFPGTVATHFYNWKTPLVVDNLCSAVMPTRGNGPTSMFWLSFLTMLVMVWM